MRHMRGLLPGTTAPGPNERLSALRSLPEGPGSLAALLAASEDPSPDIARVALRRLGRSGATSAAGPLRSRMLDVDPALTADFARALSGLGDPDAARQAATALIEERPHRRIAAATALEVLAGEDQLPPLLGALHDPLAAVRVRSLRTLARIGAAVDLPSCVAALRDEDAAVRTAAVETVAALGNGPRPELERLAQDRASDVRRAVARHRGLLGHDPTARLLADRQPSVRVAAAEAAARADLPELEQMLDRDPVPEVRIAAARRLAEIDVESSAAVLIRALADPRLMVRAAAERSLREAIGRDATVDRLLDALSDPDPDPDLRKGLIYGLAHLRAVEAEPTLVALTHDPDREVRLAAVHCAAEIFGASWSRLADLRADPDPAVAYAATLAGEALPTHAPRNDPPGGSRRGERRGPFHESEGGERC